MSIHVVECIKIHSFLWLNNIPLWKYATFSLVCDILICLMVILFYSIRLYMIKYLRKSCETESVSWFNSVQSLSRVWLFATPWIAARQAPLSITISWSSLKLMSIGSVMPSSHLSPFPPAPNPSQHHSLFQWVNSSHEVAKVLEFQL